MNTQVSPKTGALRWGLILGIFAGALLDATILLAYLFPVALASVSNLAAVTVFGVCLLLCGYAGYLAVKKTGRVANGLRSGLCAGVVSGVISSPISLLLNYTNSEIVRQQILLIVLAFGCTLGIYIMLALSAGVIGGKLAQRSLARTR